MLLPLYSLRPSGGRLQSTAGVAGLLVYGHRGGEEERDAHGGGGLPPSEGLLVYGHRGGWATAGRPPCRYGGVRWVRVRVGVGYGWEASL